MAVSYCYLALACNLLCSLVLSYYTVVVQSPLVITWVGTFVTGMVKLLIIIVVLAVQYVLT